MTRQEEQENLIYELGLLLRPIEDLGKRPSDFDETARKRIRARFHGDLTQYRGLVRQFCMGDATHQYVVEWNAIKVVLTELGNRVRDHLLEVGQDTFDQMLCFSQIRPKIIRGICDVPVGADSTIHDSASPFATYVRLRVLCSTAGHRLVWADRYFDSSVFHRFLLPVPESTEVTLVTRAHTSGGRDAARWREFLDVSRLYAQEHGAKYRLVDADFHDRWLLVDNQPFGLGGSVKDLGKDPVTISALDPTPPNIEKVTKLVNEGAELFGPKTAHP